MGEVLFSATALLCGVLLLRRVLGRQISMRLRYGLWGLVLLRLLLPVSLPESPVSLLNALPERPAATALRAGAPGPAAPGDAAPGGGGALPAPGGAAQAPERAAPAAPARGPDAGEVLGALWLAGALGVGGWLLWVNLRFARRARRLAVPCPGVACPLPVYRLEVLPSPCLAGLVRPRVYLPEAVLSDPAALEHVLTHELCHRRHGDQLWALLRGVCLALWWFHPLVWAAAVLSRRDGELACDEAALERLGEGRRAAYGRTLVALAARPGGAGDLLGLSTAMAAGRRELRERVRHVAEHRRMKRPVLALTLALAAALAACTFTGPSGPEVGPSPATSAPAGAAAAPGGPDGRARREGVYTFLVAGLDQSGGNTDTIMAASYDRVNQRAGLVSIPRDTLVERSWPKINAIYADEGIEGLRDAVSDLLGIPIDHYVTVDRRGFERLVDAAGGVDFEVPCAMDYDDPTQDLHIRFQAGMQHLDGKAALEVARFRHNNDLTGYTDLGRAGTQRALLAAVGRQVLANPGAIGEYVGIFMDSVETDLSGADVLWLAMQALQLEPGSLSTATLPGDGSVQYSGAQWCYELEPQGTLDLVNAYLNPYDEALTLEDLDILQAE